MGFYFKTRVAGEFTGTLMNLGEFKVFKSFLLGVHTTTLPERTSPASKKALAAKNQTSKVQPGNKG